MEEHVPTDFIKVAKCFALDFVEEEKTLAVICTTSGQIIEFLDKQIIESYDLNEDANEITVFTSYNPVQKFYLVKCKTKLVVVKRTSPMCVVKSFENVTHLEIFDKLCIGRPQAVITTLDDKEPIVTDFVGQLHSVITQPVPPLTTSLNSKLQEMNLRLEKARQLLQEKKTARINALYQLTPNLTCPENKTQGLKTEPKVLAWGPPFPTQGQVPQSPLQLSKPWRRAHNGKWIIGIPVFNTQSL